MNAKQTTYLLYLKTGPPRSSVDHHSNNLRNASGRYQMQLLNQVSDEPSKSSFFL